VAHITSAASTTESMSFPNLLRHVDIAIVGAGFSGVAMAVRLLESGFDDLVVLERADELGGTWRDNSYPGCACDVPSHLYSFSFAPNPEWKSTFSPQADILAYLRRVAEQKGVLRRIRFGCEVERARWDEPSGRWHLETSLGRLSARAVVLASGPLSEPAMPPLAGLERFQGAVFHSAAWHHEHDLAGERIAVIGTGASAIQFVPEIQPRASRVFVFQRTPAWIVPSRDRPLRSFERRLYRKFPSAQRAMRAAIYWGRELYALPLLRPALATVVEWLALRHLRRQVPDPELRRKLTPSYRPGCKRILISDDFYPALGQPNVELVTDPISEVRERSIVTVDGAERAVDSIIFGTGFHVTDMPIAGRVHGLGQTLESAWAGSPQAYRGTTVAGFPNLFLLLGPNTGLGHTSVVVMAEAQARYVVEALGQLRRRAAGVLEVREEAMAAWNRDVQSALTGTVWTTGGCRSWYLDRNGLNTTLWPGFATSFVLALSRFDMGAYTIRSGRVRAGASRPPPDRAAAAPRPATMGR
jgi:cation diffusion facilitator CzcD-associated flavoprotein CzcO